jgi:hypothetical protein
MRFTHAGIAALLTVVAVGAAQAQPPVTGAVRFAPKGDQHNVPECYRLDAHQFDFEMNP